MDNFPDLNKIIQSYISKQFEAVNLEQRNAMKLSLANSQIFKPNFSEILNGSPFNFDEIFSKTNITNLSKTFNYNSQNLLKITEQFRKSFSKQVKIELPPLYKSVRTIDSWTEIVNENGIVKRNPNGLKVESYQELFTTPESTDFTSSDSDDIGVPPKDYNKEIFKELANKIAIGTLEPTSGWYIDHLINQNMISHFFILIIFLQITVAIATSEKKTDKLDDE